MQIGLRKPLESKHLIEFATRGCIIDVDKDRHGRDNKAAKP